MASTSNEEVGVKNLREREPEVGNIRVDRQPLPTPQNWAITFLRRLNSGRSIDLLSYHDNLSKLQPVQERIFGEWKGSQPLIALVCRTRAGGSIQRLMSDLTEAAALYDYPPDECARALKHLLLIIENRLLSPNSRIFISEKLVPKTSLDQIWAFRAFNFMRKHPRLASLVFTIAAGAILSACGGQAAAQPEATAPFATATQEADEGVNNYVDDPRALESFFENEINSIITEFQEDFSATLQPQENDPFPNTSFGELYDATSIVHLGHISRGEPNNYFIFLESKNELITNPAILVPNTVGPNEFVLRQLGVERTLEGQKFSLTLTYGSIARGTQTLLSVNAVLDENGQIKSINGEITYPGENMVGQASDTFILLSGSTFPDQGENAFIDYIYDQIQQALDERPSIEEVSLTAADKVLIVDTITDHPDHRYSSFLGLTEDLDIRDLEFIVNKLTDGPYDYQYQVTNKALNPWTRIIFYGDEDMVNIQFGQALITRNDQHNGDNPGWEQIDLSAFVELPDEELDSPGQGGVEDGEGVEEGDGVVEETSDIFEWMQADNPQYQSLSFIDSNGKEVPPPAVNAFTFSTFSGKDNLPLGITSLELPEGRSPEDLSEALAHTLALIQPDSEGNLVLPMLNLDTGLFEDNLKIESTASLHVLAGSAPVHQSGNVWQPAGFSTPIELEFLTITSGPLATATALGYSPSNNAFVGISIINEAYLPELTDPNKIANVVSMLVQPLNVLVMDPDVLRQVEARDGTIVFNNENDGAVIEGTAFHKIYWGEIARQLPGSSSWTLPFLPSFTS